jgi:hypothetical protein
MESLNTSLKNKKFSRIRKSQSNESTNISIIKLKLKMDNDF